VANARQVLIKILTKGDPSGAQDVSKSLDHLGNTADRVGKKLSIGLTAPLVGFGAVAAKFAADAAEVDSKLEAVFGDRTESIKARLDELRENIPATSAQLRGMAAEIQDLLVPLGIAPDEAQRMTEKVIELAGDLASFNNIPMQEALERIRSGLVGQYEPLLKFGVALNATEIKARALEQGIGDGTRQLTAQERALVVFNEILAKTTAAHGDAARTKESDANQTKFLFSETKELATIIGGQILPVLTPMVSSLKDAAAAGQDLNPVILQMGVGLGAVAAAAGPALIATSAIIKYRVALQAGAAAVGPWLPIAAAAAAAYAGIAEAAREATDANQDFRDSIGLNDTSYVDSILGAETQEALDLAIAQTKVKLEALAGTIADQKKQIEDTKGFKLFESGVANTEIRKGLEEELMLMEAQAESMAQAIALGKERGSELIASNQTVGEQVEKTEELTELQKYLNNLTEEEKNIRQETLADAELEIAILDARIAGNEKLLKQLEGQKKAQIIAARLEKGGATAEEAAALADQIVQKTNQAVAAEEKRNRAKRDGIALTREAAGAEEEAQRRLRKGVRSEDFIGVGGTRGTRYLENGRVITEEEAFEGPSPGPNAGQGAATGAAQTPSATADLSPVVQALGTVNVDTRPLVAAVTAIQARLQQQIDDAASQIQQLGN
jgi:hypothetical protein